jgi:hypothetical protein
MSALTAGNWIAFQNEAQKRDIEAWGSRWSIGLDHPVELCRGVNGDDYMLVSGICTEADAKAMAASKELLELAYQYQSDLRHPPTSDSVERRLERIATVLVKVGGA